MRRLVCQYANTAIIKPLLEDTLSPVEAATLEKHLDQCLTCMGRFMELYDQDADTNKSKSQAEIIEFKGKDNR